MNLGRLSSLLAVAGGAVGLANSDSFAQALSSGAAIVAGVAGATGHADAAKIAGITSLGAGAYDVFGGAKTAEKTSSTVDAAQPSSTIADTLASDRLGGPSATGKSFSDAGYEAQRPGGDPSAALATVAPVPDPRPAVASRPPSLIESARAGLDGVGGFIDKNKELVKLAGGALDGAFGAGAQQTSLLKARLAQQQAILDRQNSNSNNLVDLQLGVRPNPNAILRRPGA